MKASGEFEVTLQPQAAYAEGEQGIKLGKMSIDKTFKGELAATSKGQMLSALTSVQGSAGYVAIEQVTGTLKNKTGSFVLQHFGIMNRGRDRLVLEVVPDSGAGALEGISGEMKIIIEDGKHFYEFEYTV